VMLLVLRLGKLLMILPSILGGHIKVTAYGKWQGAGSSTLNCGTPSLRRKLIEEER